MTHVLVPPRERFVRDESRPKRLWDAERLLNEPGQLENRDGLRGTDVDDLGAGFRPGERAHERINGVLDVRERPNLLAVAVDVDDLAAQQRLVEGDHRAAPP